jgi:hypothetical protein
MGYNPRTRTVSYPDPGVPYPAFPADHITPTTCYPAFIRDVGMRSLFALPFLRSRIRPRSRGRSLAWPLS